MDYRALLKKYIQHVGAAEGDAFARDADMAPCEMGEWEFTAEERAALERLFVELDLEDPMY